MRVVWCVLVHSTSRTWCTTTFMVSRTCSELSYVVRNRNRPTAKRIANAAYIGAPVESILQSTHSFEFGGLAIELGHLPKRHQEVLLGIKRVRGECDRNQIARVHLDA